MSTTERVTVTLSSELVEAIDLLERNRSRFIAEAVQHELTRRRREALLKSVHNPHPETGDLVDTGLGHWAQICQTTTGSLTWQEEPRCAG